MTKSTRNSGKPWTPVETKSLKSFAKENTPTRVIGLKLGRTEGAVRTKASEERLSKKSFCCDPLMGQDYVRHA